MAGSMSVATGVVNSVIEKLSTLLGEGYKHYNMSRSVRHGIRFMRDELRSMNAALHRLAEIDDDQINVQTREWRSKVRELSYDIEDCIDRFMLLHSSEKAKENFVQSMVRRIKEVWGDRQVAQEIQELKARVIEEKERHDRYNIDQYINVTQTVHLDPRVPTMYQEATDLVGIDAPRDEIIESLKGDDRLPKVVAIYGIGGQGKTTLALEVYRKIEEPFDVRAIISVSRTPDIKKLLRHILFQVNISEYDRSERWDIEQLIPKLREQLMDKR